MSYQPVVGAGGYAGWKILSRTATLQRGLIARDPAIARDNEHFRTRMASVTSAEQLVGDSRLLRTALSAYGLEADASKRFFIRKVLESDLADPRSLANRLGDKRYRTMAEAFGFGAGGKRATGLVATVTERHVAAELERRVGTADGNLRLAMNAQRELPLLAASGATDRGKWFSILGSMPLRKVFEGALGLGKEFGKLPIDRQADELAERTQRVTGSSSVSAFSDSASVEKLLTRFLVRAGAATGTQSSYNAALALLG